MKTERYQFLSIVAVFTFGFFSHDLIHNTKNGDDVYYQDKRDSLQCTINLDCDNHYDRSMFFPKEEVPQHMYLLEIPDELKHHKHHRMYRS